MLEIKGGTLLSYLTFFQQAPNVKTKFILANARKSPAIHKCEINIISSKNQKLIDTFFVESNKSSVVNLDNIETTDDDVLVFTLKEVTGIPLYLTHTDDFSEMSFEHTHPPAEMLIFGDRIQQQRHMKSYWLSRF